MVNRLKSRTAPLKQCAFLQGPETVHATCERNHPAQPETQRRDVIDELRRDVTGWMNYFGIGHTNKVVLELEQWLRRRVRFYHWKAWKQPRTRRRHLIGLGILPKPAKLATRSRKGYWRMSGNSIVQRALNKRWLHEQGVPDLRSLWIALHYAHGTMPNS